MATMQARLWLTDLFSSASLCSHLSPSKRALFRLQAKQDPVPMPINAISTIRPSPSLHARPPFSPRGHWPSTSRSVTCVACYRHIDSTPSDESVCREAQAIRYDLIDNPSHGKTCQLHALRKPHDALLMGVATATAPSRCRKSWCTRKLQSSEPP